MPVVHHSEGGHLFHCRRLRRQQRWMWKARPVQREQNDRASNLHVSQRIYQGAKRNKVLLQTYVYLMDPRRL